MQRLPLATPSSTMPSPSTSCGWMPKKGRVAVYGINFDTGKSSITADSAVVLDEVRS